MQRAEAPHTFGPAALTASGPPAKTGVSGKLIAVLAVAGAAVAGGIVYATHGGNGATATPTTTTTIAAGAGTVGPPR